MSDSDESDPDVLVVGGGVAGTTTALFTARAGLETLVVNHGESILNRNAHLENFPGFPAGVNSRTLLDLLHEQAERNGVGFRDGRVTRVAPAEAGLAVRCEGPDDEFDLRVPFVVCASWSDTEYLHHDDLDVGLVDRGSKTYVDVDEYGASGVDGLYAAGRIAGKAHQTVVAAGHGAEVGLSIVEESEVPFYHDWVAPEGYFTERGREVPPGCEEIDEEERRRRERESMAVMQEHFADPHPGEPTMHPSVVEKREGDSEGD